MERLVRRQGTIGVVAAMAASLTALLVAGCGGSSAGRVARLGTTTTSTRAASAAAQPAGWLAFATCMREHGVPRYPDPVGGGAPPKRTLQQLGVAVSRFRSADTSCRHLLPNGGLPPSPAEQQRVSANALKFAQCVRAHGVPGFPDPDGSGRIPDPATAGIDQGSPAFESANRACGRYRPPYMPSNSAYNAWARTHGGG